MAVDLAERGASSTSSPRSITMKAPTKRFTRPRIPRPVRIARSREGARRPPGAAAPARSPRTNATLRQGAAATLLHCTSSGCPGQPIRGQDASRRLPTARSVAVTRLSHILDKMPRQRTCKDTPAPRHAPRIKKMLGVGKPAAPTFSDAKRRRHLSGLRAFAATRILHDTPPRRRCSRRTRRLPRSPQPQARLPPPASPWNAAARSTACPT